MSPSRARSQNPSPYVPLSSFPAKDTSPKFDTEDPLLFAAFDADDDDYRETGDLFPTTHNMRQFTPDTSMIELLAPLDAEADSIIEEGGLTAIVSLPEVEFLNLMLHQRTLDNAQELCRARIDHLKSTDDARKLSRTPFYKVAFYRSPAIILTLFLELIVAAIIASYTDLRAKHSLLSAFIPVLSSISGNIGLQASTTTLRALATGHASNASVHDIMRVMLKELLSAIVIAFVSCIALIGIGQAWSGSLRFGLVTGSAIFVSSSLGGVIGSIGPLLFKSVGIDPALTAGPFETAVQDMLGVSVYLGLASRFLQ